MGGSGTAGRIEAQNLINAGVGRGDMDEDEGRLFYLIDSDIVFCSPAVQRFSFITFRRRKSCCLRCG